MHPPTRSQQQAIAARGNVLVSAGAGTGKTSTLVQRCLKLLDEGVSIDKILMVTFTEAAATEMRGRIREALQDRVRTLAADRPVDPGRIEHFEKQLALLDTALISTLHSFCLQLVREHFYELGIDPDIRVLDGRQTRPLTSALLDAMLERHYAGETPNAAAVQTLVRAQGDDRVRAMIGQLHRYSQSLAAPGTWLDRQKTLFSQANPVQWREWFIGNFEAWRAAWRPMLTGFAANPAVAAVLAAFERTPQHPSPDHVCAALLAIRAADDGEGNWPRGSKKQVREPLKEFFADARFLASLVPAGGRDPLAEDWELARQDMRTLLELAGEFTPAFTRAKSELGGVDFADLEQLALRVLRDADTGAPTATARQWQQRLEHVFVDEYQDINAAQDAILTAVSRPGAAGNRFLVGDIKQSIYRFRLADPAIFGDYAQRWGGGEAGCARIPLCDNFRSRPAILDFVNALFRSLMRETVGGVAYEELTPGLGPDGAADPRDDSPPVELHLISRGESQNGEAGLNAEETAARLEVADLLVTEREARLVALRLRELKNRPLMVRDGGGRRPVRWGDMAVLLRSPANRVEAFAKEFAALAIPLEAARGGFFQSTEILDLVSLLRVLDNPMQDIPFLSVLRSPLVGMSLKELAEIRARDVPGPGGGKSFWMAARRFHQRAGRSESAWEKLDWFFGRLESWREAIRRSSLSECLERVLAETGYESVLRAGPRGGQRIANVRRLLQLVREHDPWQRQGLFRFLRFLEAQEEADAEIEPAPEDRDAVRLASIHRSKGLEFPVVVLAGLGWQFNVRDLNDNILVDPEYGLCPKILPQDGEQRYPSLAHWLARRRRRQELLGEELRLLYVAMTRARDWLVLTGTSGKKGARWDEAAGRDITDPEVSSAQCGLDWLKLWLAGATHEADWRSDREGQTRLLQWRLYAEDDPVLALKPDAPGPVTGEPEMAASATELSELGARLSWIYSFAGATRQRAKTSVTELRRHEEDEDAEAAPFVPHHRFGLSVDSERHLTAAEVGVAHHRFLERISLSEVGGIDDLQRQARRLGEQGWLSEREIGALDFDALAHFWGSDLGRRVAGHAPSVRRELQFTSAFTAADLVACGLKPSARLPAGEFVVVQGMVDLAVLLPEEIWIVDFKTDAVDQAGIAAKAELYAPQLKLYSRALSRIYDRKVTECSLYFLAQRAFGTVA